jgi:hypothetical protein
MGSKRASQICNIYAVLLLILLPFIQIMTTHMSNSKEIREISIEELEDITGGSFVREAGFNSGRGLTYFIFTMHDCAVWRVTDAMEALWL